jgi:hypothetical protein
VHEQVAAAVAEKGVGSLQDLIYSGDTWIVE